jgi:Fe-S cluster assembly iron-binding protein IscA
MQDLTPRGQVLRSNIRFGGAISGNGELHALDQEEVSLVLTISPDASHAIRGILDASDAPDGAMFRIAPQGQDGTEPGPSLAVSIIEAPPADDQIVQGEDVEVSVEPSVAVMLDDKELDATVSGEQINFSIAEQAE